MSGPEGEAPFDGPIQIPIEDSIDLHGFAPAEIPDVVDAYLEAALEAGFGEVRLVHGRGRGVQRHRIRRRLARDPRVVAFRDATPERGGFGATIVRLRDAQPGGDEEA